MNYDKLFTSKLPIVLPEEKLNDYLKKYQNGDSEAKAIIIEHNIRLVLYQVYNKFSNVPYDKQDLVSIGIIGLIKAIENFDLSKKIKFITFATRCIDNEILMFMKKGKKYINNDSLDREIEFDKDGNSRSLKDFLEDESANFVIEYENQETQNEIRKIVEHLPKRDKEIIMLHFGFYDNKIYNQKEIAEIFGISQSYVSRIIQNSLKKIGEELMKLELIDTTRRVKNKKVITQKEIKSNKDTSSPKTTFATEKGSTQKMPKKLRTIYELFKEYTKEEVDDVILKLSEEERYIIELRYGKDLEKPKTSPDWNKEYQKEFYGKIIYKMKKSLSNKTKLSPQTEKVIKVAEEKNQDIKNSLSSSSVASDYKSKEDQNLESIIELPKQGEASTSLSKKENLDLTKEDYLKILTMLKAPSFREMLNLLTVKEAIIISLKLGYIDNKYFSTEEIAKFLEIEPTEVREITKKVLLLYEEKINNFIDEAITIVSERPSKLTKTKI